MLFDTDVLISFQRGHAQAAEWIDASPLRLISAQTYMELLQGAQSKAQHKMIRDFLKDFEFECLPITHNISHRATIYVEEYALSHGMRAGDALIAATAMEYGHTLLSGNIKHFRCIPNLTLKIFKV